MKLNKRHLSLTFTVFSLAIVLLTFNHCGLDSLTKVKVNKKLSSSHSTNGVPDGGVEGGGDPTDPGEEEAEIVMQEVYVGVKSFEEIYMTMSVLTGVAPNKDNVDNVYADISVQLPSDNDIKSFISVNQVAITKLAAEYCHELIDDGSLRAMIWPTTNFGESASTALVGAKKDRIIDDAIKAFWQISNAQLFEYNMERGELSLLIDELRAGEANNSTTTRNVIKATCTAILSSAHVTML